MVNVEELIEVLKKENVIERGGFNLRGGGKSNLYINIKKSYGNPKALGLMAARICDLISLEANCVAGSGFGGIPLATRISQIKNYNLTLIRNEVKNHGRINLIDGHVPNKDDLVIVADDVFTSRSSIRETAKIIKSTGAKIVGAYVVCKRGDGDLELPVYHLITPEDLE